MCHSERPAMAKTNTHTPVSCHQSYYAIPVLSLVAVKHAIFDLLSLPSSPIDITCHLERFRLWLQNNLFTHVFSWPNTWNKYYCTCSITLLVLVWINITSVFVVVVLLLRLFVSTRFKKNDRAENFCGVVSNEKIIFIIKINISAYQRIIIVASKIRIWFVMEHWHPCFYYNNIAMWYKVNNMLLKWFF